MNGFMRDFRGFALSGNVADLAIGVLPVDASRCMFCTSDLEPVVSD